jgi:hypothetical protein
LSHGTCPQLFKCIHRSLDRTSIKEQPRCYLRGSLPGDIQPDSQYLWRAERHKYLVSRTALHRHVAFFSFDRQWVKRNSARLINCNKKGGRTMPNGRLFPKWIRESIGRGSQNRAFSREDHHPDFSSHDFFSIRIARHLTLLARVTELVNSSILDRKYSPPS